MSKNNTNNASPAKDRNNLTKFCAFWALAISAFMYIFSGLIDFIIRKVENLGASKTGEFLSTLSGITRFLGNIALIIAIAIPAYAYVRNKKKGWKICYWIALVIFGLGVVFGLISNWI